MCVPSPGVMVLNTARNHGDRARRGRDRILSTKLTRALVIGRVFLEDFFDLQVVLRSEVPECVFVIEGCVAVLIHPHTQTHVPSGQTLLTQ